MNGRKDLLPSKKLLNEFEVSSVVFISCISMDDDAITLVLLTSSLTIIDLESPNAAYFYVRQAS